MDEKVAVEGAACASPAPSAQGAELRELSRVATVIADGFGGARVDWIVKLPELQSGTALYVKGGRTASPAPPAAKPDDDEAFRQFQRERIEAARKHDAEEARNRLAAATEGKKHG